jgi:hypothetical protein
MNKEELKELAATLNGIADGKAWEYCCFTGPKEEWFESMIGTDPVSLLARGQGIRLKPQPDPYAKLKAAHAAGKVIQCRINELDEWDDSSPSWYQPPHCYRIKPEQQKVPLDPGDVPPGSVIRDSKTPLGRWFLVLSVGPSGLATNSDSLKTFDSLTDGWEIIRPTDTEWQPCYKLIDTP